MKKALYLILLAWAFLYMSPSLLSTQNVTGDTTEVVDQPSGDFNEEDLNFILDGVNQIVSLFTQGELPNNVTGWVAIITPILLVLFGIYRRGNKKGWWPWVKDKGEGS